MAEANLTGQVNIRLTPAEYDALNSMAEAEKRSVSALARLFVQEGLRLRGGRPAPLMLAEADMKAFIRKVIQESLPEITRYVQRAPKPRVG